MNIELIIEQFLNDFKSQNKSINTINSYKIDLQQLLKHLKDKDIQNITTRDLQNYLNLSYEKGSSDNTRARKLATIKSFFKYCKKQHFIKVNIADELNTIKIEKKQPVYLTLNEAQNFLNVVKKENNIRDYCIISLFLHTGLRVSELCGLNLKDIKEDTLLIHGKGNKQRIVQLNQTIYFILQEYMRYRKKLRKTRKKDIDKALFITQKKTRVTKSSIENLVIKYTKKAGITKKITPHKLRHTCASLMYRNGVNILEIQELLGHSNINTTRIYTHLDNTQKKQAVNANPLNNL